MHIFIDESGGFQRNERAASSISCVCAVIIPGRSLVQLETDFIALTRTWPRSPAGEIKGRLLHEQHVVDLCAFLKPLHVLLEVVVMDMNLCSLPDVDLHKSRQAEGMTANLTPEHHPDVASSLWRLRGSLEQMPRQLYAQSVALTEACWTAFQHGQLYFCQRWPGELGRFRWVLDAKDHRKITDYELWWRQSVMPLLQSRSLREPGVMLRGGDYSTYRQNFPMIKIPPYLSALTPNTGGKGDDLRAIFRELEFAESGKHVGLQIVDVLANALRRSLSGRMARSASRALAELTIHQAKGAVVLKSFATPEGMVLRSYAYVINEINAGGRSMVRRHAVKRR